ncbi:RING-H2 finger protein [Musa troglodytarum]|uniref:RING-type E3 ubiquitin transferase n=1 Tax=Musa troglodytarum TaxID=320322 RepID=A0A9E7I2M0_9LILI|nr:RING-H2 finger protein [Musa troglodytarum]
MIGRAMASRPDRLLGPLARDDEDSYEPPTPPFLLCPPPPPPPPPPSQDHPTLLPALPVALASLLTAAVVVIFITIFIYRRRRRRRRLAAASTAEDPGPFENGGGEVDHHVWYIRTTGLDESTIGAITAWAYKAADGVLGDSPADCAVCLSEFRDGELLRLLPKCGHAFHVSCIDTWLRSHVNCPLCRAPVVAPTSAPSGADPRTITPTFSSALSSPAFSLDGMDPNSIPSGVLDSNQIDGRQLGSGQGVLEVETEGEDLELGAGVPIVADHIPNSDLRVPSDIGEQGFEPIRRSFSMGSFAHAPSLHRLELEEGLTGNTKEAALREEWDGRTSRKQGTACSGTTTLQKETERSSSSASGGFFLLRHISRALGLSSSNADVQVTEIASSAPRVQDSKSYERLLYGGKQMESSKGTSPPLESCTTSDGLLLLSHPLMYVGNHLPPADRNQA